MWRERPVSVRKRRPWYEAVCNFCAMCTLTMGRMYSDVLNTYWSNIQVLESYQAADALQAASGVSPTTDILSATNVPPLSTAGATSGDTISADWLGMRRRRHTDLDSKHYVRLCGVASSCIVALLSAFLFVAATMKVSKPLPNSFTTTSLHYQRIMYS